MTDINLENFRGENEKLVIYEINVSTPDRGKNGIYTSGERHFSSMYLLPSGFALGPQIHLRKDKTKLTHCLRQFYLLDLRGDVGFAAILRAADDREILLIFSLTCDLICCKKRLLRMCTVTGSSHFDSVNRKIVAHWELGIEERIEDRLKYRCIGISWLPADTNTPISTFYSENKTRQFDIAFSEEPNSLDYRD
ncbi:hypothetical protein NQ317_013987 [Molorchus minor]|uniref:Uncharacterized protein n=1 Tax=Molorchus minor TaxID=1323400 RepID=A0ABQ9JFQ0_9CUCU|nr:hypothetical protein NQ317_013987 [Molorchus minor]